MSPMKIGVLTFHRCINYGSYWQARCLCEGLRGMGHDAVLLDHHSRAVNRREWRCALAPQLPARPSPSDRSRYATKTRRFFKAFDRLPQSQPFDLDDPRALDDWDIVVVGSDEVWNLSHPWYGGHAIFYGSGLKAGRLVSYAASFGNQQARAGLPPFWADALANFTMISVRDANSARIVREATGTEPEMVLDPCLQFPPALKVLPLPNERPYAAVYGHGFPDWFCHAVRHWASEAGYRLISVGYRNDWTDEHHIDAGPHAFASLIAGAAAVATNFFHGCVFAMLNDKPFACVRSDYRANKLEGLMRLVSADARLLDESARPRYGNPLTTPIASETRRRIDELRLSSGRFLERAMAA